MSYLIVDPALVRVRCTITHLDADALGVRLVESPNSPLVVAAAPWARLPALIEGLGDLRVAAYVLAGACYPEGAFLRLYIGETGAVRERLLTHARDPRKDFASGVFVLTSRDPGFSKLDAEALQWLLDRRAEEADRGMIIRGTPPLAPAIDAAAWARAETWIAQARLLLAAAGCLMLEPRVALAPRDPSVNHEPTATVTMQGEIVGPLKRCETHDRSDALQPPPLSPDTASRTYLLQRRGLWAMAVETDGRFVIRAGSEMARKTIASCDPSTLRRRKGLAEAAILADVPGRSDRWRLLRDVPIASLTGAARVLTGSHCGGRIWQPVRLATTAP